MKSWIAIALSFVLFICTSAFTIKDAVSNLGGEQQGADILCTLVKVLKDFNDHRISSEQTQECYGFLADSLEEFQFQKVYDSHYLTSGPKGYKGLTFHGYPKKDGYVFNLAQAHSGVPSLAAKGSMTADAAFKRHYRSAVGEPSFSTYFNAEANTGRLSHESVNRFLDDLLLVLDPKNLRQLEASACASRSDGCGKKVDVAAQLMEAFPNSSRFFGHFSDLKVDYEIISVEGKEFTKAAISSSLFLNKLNDDFPWTAAHLDNLEGALRADMRFLNEFGHRILEVKAQTDEDFLTMSFCTSNGKVLPTDGFGKPEYREDFSFKNLTVLPVDLYLDLYTKANGLKFSTKGLRILVDYEKLDEAMLLSIRSDNLVDTRVSGMAMYVLPTWSIDWLLPSSMEELIFDFSSVMIQANNGEGSFVKIMCDAQDKDNAKTQFYASTEVLDNFFVRFGAKMALDYFGMGPITSKEAKKFRSQALEAILADFQVQAEKTAEARKAGAVPSA
ncbi:hypothetical protein [Desulfatibacillum aliphaticivorans]|uniref:hypothetical protein n=1 Tax=Desulfatibacillum aliphaticivorans TaxID=218208 RepID=UPI00040102A9|nr:hypothetical protein [Desulfatibacillum aliphaticivorans]